MTNEKRTLLLRSVGVVVAPSGSVVVSAGASGEVAALLSAASVVSVVVSVVAALVVATSVEAVSALAVSAPVVSGVGVTSVAGASGVVDVVDWDAPVTVVFSTSLSSSSVVTVSVLGCNGFTPSLKYVLKTK